MAGGWWAARPRLLTWGATVDEASRTLPGDDLVPHALYETTRAVTIAAPAEAVFPWLVQLGQNRGGFYTYDLLENAFGLNIHSADRVHPEWQDLQVGVDYVTLDPQQVMKMAVAILEPPYAFVIRTGTPGEPQPAGSFFKGEIDGSWAFVVEPIDQQTSRLIVRWRAAWRQTAAARVARLLLLEPAHFVMERGMLVGIRRRAEATAV
jgi:hypothetical protein